MKKGEVGPEKTYKLIEEQTTAPPLVICAKLMKYLT